MLRRRVILKAPIGRVDTTPKIAEYGKYLYRSATGTGTSNNWCYTIWYDIIPEPGRTNSIKIGNCNIDADRTYQFTTSLGGADWDYRKSGANYMLPATANKIRISIPINNLSICYAFITSTGQILFAGEDTIYYGYKNINDMPQGN